MAISISTATQAVDALIKWKSSQSNSQNPQLLPEDDFIYLILTLKKIPQKGGINGARTNPHKVPLPHPLISPTSFPELCLIIDDRPNSKLTSEIAKKKIKADGISVTKVLKLSKLKTDYKPFEAKRKLCDSYEMFFADKRVIPLLPKLLGKQFFKKKKLPLPVDLGHKNWKEQIERGCSSGLLFFRTGTCSVIRVAKASMERDEIIENVGSAINGVLEFVPKKLSGVRSLHLKFSESVALPLYQSLPDIKLRIEGVKEKNVEVVEGEAMEIEEVGKKKGSKKGRIHEVNHDMDEDEGGEIENNESGSVELVSRKRKGQLKADKPAKKSGGRIHEVHSEGDEGDLGSDSDGDDNNESKEIEKDDLGSAELVARKRKGEFKGAKQVKKSAKEKMGVAKKSDKEKRGAKDDGDSGKKKGKGNVVEGDDLNTILIGKKEKKKVEKQNGDTGKKERKKGRSVAKV
ncbi:Ribosomal protein L1 [Cynara cardunculus var. scolymus]|uniref:Ribosomal protein L1 n=2 Tax=Cynara cardunculus var. scolymus TaxID=59895 RepID=A0A124SGR3_CYNCS|nr:Ribosomal protein L1 [Cynara cardunculus var. scolymus]